MTDEADTFEGLDPRQRELVALLMQQPSSAAPHAGPKTPAEAELARIWSEVLGTPSPGIHDNFFELGGDSILSMQVVSRARKRGFLFGTRQLFEYPTIAGLAEWVAASAPVAPPQPARGPLPIAPIQRWFFGLGQPNPHHWNLGAALHIGQAVDPHCVRVALDKVIQAHEMLGLRCDFTDQGARLRTVSPGHADLIEVHLDAGQDMASVAASLHRGLNLTEGPVVRAALVTAPGGGQDLVLSVHHLACDWVGMRTLLEDFESAYLAAEEGTDDGAPAGAGSYRDYADRVLSLPPGVGRREAMEAWYRTLLPHAAPAGRAAQRDTEASTRWVEAALSAQDTEVLIGHCGSYSAHEVLLHAAGAALCEMTGDGAVVMNVETHGRDAAAEAGDFSRTVGWFACIAPVLVERIGIPGAEGLERTSRAWHAARDNAWTYMQACYGESPTHGPVETDFGFNYLGRFGSPDGRRRFRVAASQGADVYAPDGFRPHGLEVVAYVLDGRLQMCWGFGGRRYAPAQVEKAALRCLDLVRETLTERPGASGGRVLFPRSGLDDEDLQRLFGAGA